MNIEKKGVKSPAIFSFFSGIGMLDLGFEKAGFETVFVNEFYHYFLDGYKHSREVMGIPKPRFGHHLKDINEFLSVSEYCRLFSQIDELKKAGRLVGFIGGPPCPDFSVGGKNRGAGGENGILSKSYIDLIIRFNPDFFLFENVKGLWRTKKHRVFYDELKAILLDNGYLITDKLINSLEYGVPQDRERIIMLGFHKRLFPVKSLKRKLEIDFPWDGNCTYNRDYVFGLPWPEKEPFREGSSTPCPKDLEIDLTVQSWFDRNDVENHPNSQHCFKPRAGLKKFKVVAEGDDSRKSSKRLHRWRYSPTACYGNNEVHLHPYKARRISAAEALSIQSLPEDFELPDSMSLTSMFKSIGNGVPYLMAFGLAKSVFGYLNALSSGVDENLLKDEELIRPMLQLSMF